jgi:hypothetical protein
MPLPLKNPTAIIFRCTFHQRWLLRDRAKKAGLSMSDYIRYYCGLDEWNEDEAYRSPYELQASRRQKNLTIEAVRERIERVGTET